MNIKISLFASIVILAAASSASAIQIQMGNSNGSDIGYYRANPHGDFESVIGNYALGKSTDGTWFGTFCIEKNEYFTPGSTYDVALNDGAISGGRNGAVNGKDIISEGTGWLYEQYAIGNFFSTVYNPYNLQKAIWFLEDELNWSDLGTKARNLVTLAATSLGLSTTDWSEVKSDYTGKNVKVMNLTSNNGQNQHQDQLVYMPVPDSGSTLALLGFASAGLLAFRRRR
ncbi:VPDSG-CTERM sorting domain-containing protein [Pelagicoccus enzymogenes]|uniref:VPDSG-CTERM sorting domain-containing protein n=1 Tax=Pelagicoccus enzymogenes TaxID=2773457 RepID=UPI00280FFD72|nr:VPDSG-CTERM sorting domain-containing protein [Pelagicoccus enzymogenes]MDQ8200728.1 VPDSG-CTERM sorting domain-containing protein [Pelagicoccus enzymogenes]